ncbi:hypothetical protein C8R43DRAFT_944980 [Mycena crocata]|nr:hypothetical protein C8R43DRAFT_944980 [Mycena crocata]
MKQISLCPAAPCFNDASRRVSGAVLHCMPINMDAEAIAICEKTTKASITLSIPRVILELCSALFSSPLVHVDVLVPPDPTNPFGGPGSNLSHLRCIDETYDIYGVFCRLDEPGKNADVLQLLLVHGFSSMSRFWSPPIEEFRKYSYTRAAFSCNRGVSSFAPGSGLSSRRESAVDVQYLNSAAVVSQLGRQAVSIIPGVKPSKKIIGVGHTLGSGLFNFGAIVDGAQSFIITSQLIFSPDDAPPGSDGSVLGASRIRLRFAPGGAIIALCGALDWCRGQIRGFQGPGSALQVVESAELNGFAESCTRSSAAPAPSDQHETGGTGLPAYIGEHTSGMYPRRDYSTLSIMMELA